MDKGRLPRKIRVSVGSAVVLGLARGSLIARPTTVYLLTYRHGRCSANCSFCPQARTSKGRKDMLSRVTWLPFPTEKVFSKINAAFEKGKIKRVCIQTLNYPTVFNDLLNLAEEIRSRSRVPISVCCQPLERRKMKKLAEAGVNRICIPLDAATEKIFDEIKGSAVSGPYVWRKQRRVLREAVGVFGEGSVSTHLIAGLGESERDMVQVIQWCVDSGIYPGLFAFTPIRGTTLEDHPQPPLRYYRRIQTAHYLMTQGKTQYEKMEFDEDDRLTDFGVSERELKRAIKTGLPFVTSGCPGCNRPYYNERPGGPLYNYPRPLLPKEIVKIEEQMEI